MTHAESGHLERSEGGISRRGGTSARLLKKVDAVEPPLGSEAESAFPLKGGCRGATGG